MCSRPTSAPSGLGSPVNEPINGPITETMPAALAGERLDRVVAMILGCTRAEAAVVVSGGGAVVDGAIVTVGKTRLREGHVVVVDPGLLPQPSAPAPDPGVGFEVVFADDEVIVVDKPAGLVVHPGAGNPDGTLVNGLLARFPEISAVGEFHRPGIVHRLDVGTSGLMVVARTVAAYRYLVAALAAREVERVYRTLVWGHPANTHGLIDAPIGRDVRDPQRMAVVVDGKPARTVYVVEATFDDPTDLAALTCRLETGRTHQIRVHLAAIGHPVVGDATYGGVRPALACPRPFLHAAELAFAHPSTGEVVRFVAADPADLLAVFPLAFGHDRRGD